MTVERGACSAVPTAALKVGTADPVPRINRTVAAAFAHPTRYLSPHPESL
jgi:hypothetical protein